MRPRSSGAAGRGRLNPSWPSRACSLKRRRSLATSRSRLLASLSLRGCKRSSRASSGLLGRKRRSCNRLWLSLSRTCWLLSLRRRRRSRQAACSGPPKASLALEEPSSTWNWRRSSKRDCRCKRSTLQALLLVSGCLLALVLYLLFTSAKKPSRDCSASFFFLR